MKSIKTTYDKTKEKDEPLCSNLQKTQDVFSIVSIDRSGIFELTEKRYSKQYSLTDINFEGLTSSEKQELILSYSKVLKTIPVRFQITCANEYVDKGEFEQTIRYDCIDASKKKLSSELNKVILDKVNSAKQGLYQHLYLTLTLKATDIEDAKAQFISIEGAIKAAFIGIGGNGAKGSILRSVGINERMQSLFNFTHPKKANVYKYDFDDEFNSLSDFSDVISPNSFRFSNEDFGMGNRVGRVYYIDTFPNSLESDIVSMLSKINATSYFSINNELLELSGFKQEVSRKYLKVGMKIEGEKKRNRNNNDFLADASTKLLNEKDRLDKFLKEIETEDEHYFNTTCLILIVAESMDELLEIEEKLMNSASLKSIVLKPCFSNQKEGINSAYPLGIQEFKHVTNFSSSCLAMLMPFKTEELNDKDGLYYGINQISQNAIRAKKKDLKNHNGLILGQSGGGKSAFAKTEMISTHVISNEDQIIVVDPQGEYKDIARELGGEIISFDSGKQYYLNPLDVDFKDVDLNDLREIVSNKSDFILSLIGTCLKRDLTAQEQGIVDSVVEKVYSRNYSIRKRLNGEISEEKAQDIPEYLKSKSEISVEQTTLSNKEQIKTYSPVLQDIYQVLMDEGSKEARYLASSMEIFVNGSLNLFNHKSNVDLDNKFVVFDLSKMKDNLRICCMLIMMETVRDRIRWNKSSDIYTHLYIDEFHELLSVPQVADFVLKLWKEIRKMQGILCGITQNMSDLLNSDSSNKLEAILSNTEFFALLSQSTLDKEKIMKFLPNISPAMFNYVDNAEPGCGLIIFGTITIPFDLRMSKDSYIYRIINTD